VLTDIKTGSLSGATVTALVQDLTFGYDGLGNLTARGNALKLVNETYGYDNLNRLTHRNGGVVASYLGNGNINTKTDVTGTTSSAYSYDATRPHAVSSAWGYAMTYDGNGNLLTRTGGGATWTTRWAGFDKPRWLAKTTSGANGKTVGSEFHYNASRSRVLHLEFDQLANNAPSHYTSKKIYAAGAALEIDYRNTAVIGASWTLETVRVYVPGPDGNAGAVEYRPATPNGAESWRSLAYHNDHLGSLETITPHGSTTATSALDDNGRPGRYSYDAWGERRNADTWTGAPVNTAKGGDGDLTPRGFTGHEMLDDLGLVHMNGRIYDPLLGRMLSADTFVQDAGDLQAYNRYSYVRNNPTSLNDPSGHFWSALITVGFAAYDTYNYATGKTTGAEYAKNMALNGAALVADVATAGQGGGLAVRAANAGIRVAKAVDKANDTYETVNAVIETGKVVASGDSAEISRAVVTAAVEHVVGGGKGKHDVDLNKNKIHADADAGKKVDPRTSPATEAQDVAKGGTYKLRDPDTGDVKRTGRTNDHERREGEHGKAGSDTEGLDYEVDTRTDVLKNSEGESR
jgi:RHS repeat-associated protein